MNLPDVETNAAKVHDTWMQNKLSLGITSRKSEEGEELMVPYADLSEPAKEVDRILVRTVYAALNEEIEDATEISRLLAEIAVQREALTEAVNEIERLSSLAAASRIARLETALRAIVKLNPHWLELEAQEIARVALEKP